MREHARFCVCGGARGRISVASWDRGRRGWPQDASRARSTSMARAPRRRSLRPASGQGGTISACATHSQAATRSDPAVARSHARAVGLSDGWQVGRESLRDGDRVHSEGAGRGRAPAVALAAPGESMELGTAGASRRSARLAAKGRRLAKLFVRRLFYRLASRRSGCWTPQLAQARSWRTCDRPGTPGELCAAPAVPPALARRRSGDRGRRHRAPWPVGRQRECGSLRVSAHRRRCARPARAALALARSPESGRGPL